MGFAHYFDPQKPLNVYHGKNIINPLNVYPPPICDRGNLSTCKTNLIIFNNETEGQFKKHGLQIVSGLSRELSNVKKAAGMDYDVLSGNHAKLEICAS